MFERSFPRFEVLKTTLTSGCDAFIYSVSLSQRSSTSILMVIVYLAESVVLYCRPYIRLTAFVLTICSLNSWI